MIGTGGGISICSESLQVDAVCYTTIKLEIFTIICHRKQKLASKMASFQFHKGRVLELRSMKRLLSNALNKATAVALPPGVINTVLSHSGKHESSKAATSPTASGSNQGYKGKIQVGGSNRLAAWVSCADFNSTVYDINGLS